MGTLHVNLEIDLCGMLMAWERTGSKIGLYVSVLQQKLSSTSSHHKRSLHTTHASGFFPCTDYYDGCHIIQLYEY